MLQNYSKYENIREASESLSNLLKQKESASKTVKLQRVELKELITSKQSMKSRFKELKNEKIIILDKNFNIQLLRAKIEIADVNKIYSDYEKEKQEIYDSYDEKYNKRVAKIEGEISALEKSIADSKFKKTIVNEKVKLNKKYLNAQRKIVSDTKCEANKNVTELKYKYDLDCLDLLYKTNSSEISKEEYDDQFLKLTNEFENQNALTKEEATNAYSEFCIEKRISIKKQKISEINKQIILSKEKYIVEKASADENYRNQMKEEKEKYKLQTVNTDLDIEDLKKIKLEHKLSVKQIKFTRHCEKNNHSVEMREFKKEKISFQDTAFSNKEQILLNFYSRVDEFQTKYKSLNAIKMTFLTVFPIVLLGAFVTLFTSVIFSTGAGSLVDIFDIQLTHELILWISRIRRFFEIIGSGTSGLVSLYIVVVMSYNVSKNYNQNVIWVSTISSVITFFLLSNNFLGSSENFSSAFGTNGMIGAILLPILVVKIFAWLDKLEPLKLKLPASIPDAVAKSLNALVPMFILLTVAAFATALLSFATPGIDHLLDLTSDEFTPRGPKTVSQIIGLIISIPMNFFFDINIIFGVFIFVILSSLVWWCGINSSAILGAFLWGKFGGSVGGSFGDSWFGSAFNDHIINLGGTGATLALIIVVLAVSKRNNWKMISKIAILPAMFCINEPILFGLPLVFNPVLLIPFILAPLSGVIMYILVHGFGIMDLTILKNVDIPWTTPPILGAYWAVENHANGAIFAVIILIVQCAVYTPFVLMDNSIYKVTLENQVEDRTFSFRADALKIEDELGRTGVSSTLEEYIDPQGDYYE